MGHYVVEKIEYGFKDRVVADFDRFCFANFNGGCDCERFVRGNFDFP